MAHAELTVNEAAELSGVSARRIEKAAEEGVVTKRITLGALRRTQSAHVSVHVVAYTSVMKQVQGLKFDLKTKKRLFRHLVEAGDALPDFELVPGVRISINTLASAEWASARSYLAAKQTFLESRDDILGGEPVIKGTRITCRSVLGRIEDGDTLEDLCAEHPDVPREAFEASVTFARAHPPRGRPAKSKPWRR